MNRRFKLWRSRLCANQQGVAAVEFGVIVVPILALLMVAIDFGLHFTQQFNVNAAASEGATYAFNMRSNNGVTIDMIENYVRTAAQTSTPPTVTITCNGHGKTETECTTRPRVCACMAGTIGAPTFGATIACGTDCGDGTTAGHYLMINVRRPLSSIIVPNRFLPSEANAVQLVRLR